MQKRRIGSLEVSAVGLGCNNFGSRMDAASAAKVMHAAMDAGIDFLDTADIYGEGLSEEYIGRTLGSLRNEVVLATKFGSSRGAIPGGTRPADVRHAAEASLRRLRTDRIDLYQLHRPNPDVPIADTLAALDELVRAGKVREIGCSNFTVPQLQEAAAAVREGAARFVSVQNHWSLLHRDPEVDVLPECERTGLAFIPYFPLESGLLTGKYRRGRPAPAGSRIARGYGSDRLTDENLARVEGLIAFAGDHGHTILELAVSWLLARGSVASVIAGATRPEQVRANAAATGWRLSTAEMKETDAIVPVPPAS
jgi:aryl-alcohol dehydrogenase-like predicted oxidoreductase